MIFKRNWTGYFASIRRFAADLSYDGEVRSGPQAGQPHVVYLVYLCLLFHIAYHYETPASRSDPAF